MGCHLPDRRGWAELGTGSARAPTIASAPHRADGEKVLIETTRPELLPACGAVPTRRRATNRYSGPACGLRCSIEVPVVCVATRGSGIAASATPPGHLVASGCRPARGHRLGRWIVRHTRLARQGTPTTAFTGKNA